MEDNYGTEEKDGTVSNSKVKDREGKNGETGMHEFGASNEWHWWGSERQGHECQFDCSE